MVRLLISGTPGTGKSTLSAKLAEKLNLTHLELSHIVKNDASLVSERDAQRDCSVFDEDKLLDHIEDRIREIEEGEGNSKKKSGVILDFHAPGFLIEAIHIDVIVLLQADTQELARRLDSRGYSKAKVSENLEAEIFKVVREEALESLLVSLNETQSDPTDISREKLKIFLEENNVLELVNDSNEDLEKNIEKIAEKVREVEEISISGDAMEEEGMEE